MGTVSGSDKLTLLLTTLFDWLEASNPDVLYYGNVPLRAAFERYFYFEAASRPERLAPLLSVTQQWRKETPYSEQAALYDYYLGEQGNFVKQIRNRGLAWLRIARDLFKHKQSKQEVDIDRQAENKGGVTVGFFAINERFIHFFSPLATHFQQEKTIYFSPDSNALKAASRAKDQAIFALDKSCKISRSNFALFPTHPLFPEYFRLCFFYERMYSVLAYWQPDVLLFAEGTSHYDELANQAAKFLDISSIRVQSGRAGILHSGYMKMSFDHMLCWGSEFVTRYQSVSPLPHYHITGSPLIDEFSQLKKVSNDLDKKKSVLIITQPISQHIKETDYLELLEIASRILTEREDVQIIVRKHPIDQHEGFEELAGLFDGRVVLMNSPEYSLAEVFVKANCTIGFFSTVISEAAACGIIPITLQNNDAQSVYPHPEKRRAAILVSSKKEAIEVALDVLDNRNHYKSLEVSMKQFSKDFFGTANTNSLVETVSFIKNLALDSSSFNDRA